MTTAEGQDRHVTVNGLFLHYLDWGTMDKQPMVCLHGHTGQCHIWDEFAQAMASSYHVYALDQRGHGQSQWATDGYEREQLVDDLATFLDDLALPTVVLVGLSMGGWNSLLYSQEHPDRVKQIVLVDIAPESSAAARQQLANRPPTPLAFDTFEEAFTWVRRDDPWAAESRLRSDLSDRMRQMDDGLWVWKADPILFNTDLRDTHDQELIKRYWRSLEGAACPVLEVRGTESQVVSDEIIERMEKSNSLFSVVDVVGAGHVVTVDKPQQFINVTRDFLQIPI